MREPDFFESYEEALRVARGLLPDDLDRVLVRTDGPVGAEAIENATDDVGRLGDEPGIVVEAGVRDIVCDPIVKWFFGEGDARFRTLPSPSPA